MKQLLILAYDFPPYVSVGGLRPYSWYKYLKEYGVYPIVVTRQWGNDFGDERDYIASSKSKETIVEDTEFGTIIRTPYKPNLANRILLKYGKNRFSLVRKAVSAFYEFAQFIFYIGPKSGLYRGACKYLKEHKVDAIIATGEPFVLFKYASKLSKIHNIPWIADYRDPWTQNVSRSDNWILKMWNSFLERKLSNSAKCITTVSDYFKCQIKQTANRPFEIIPNGYDQEAVDSTLNIEQDSDCLKIAFIGTIYKWHPLESILECLVKFASCIDSPKFEFNLFGINNPEEIKHLVCTKYPTITNNVNIHARISNDELLKTLARHNVMLLFNYYSFMGTKIYDYIGIKRKILLCYSNDAEALELKKQFYSMKEFDDLSTHLQEDLINETHSGIVVRDKNHLSQVLTDLYEEFKVNGRIACNSTNTDKLSRKARAEELANLVKRV